MSRPATSPFDAFGGAITTLLNQINAAHDGQCSMDTLADTFVSLTQRTTTVFKDFLRKSMHSEDVRNEVRINAMSMDIDQLMAKLKSYSQPTDGPPPDDRSDEPLATPSKASPASPERLRTRSRRKAAESTETGGEASEDAESAAAVTPVRRSARIAAKSPASDDRRAGVRVAGPSVDARDGNARNSSAVSTAQRQQVMENGGSLTENSAAAAAARSSDSTQLGSTPGTAFTTTTRAMKRKIVYDLDAPSTSSASAAKRKCPAPAPASADAAPTATATGSAPTAKAVKKRIVYDLGPSTGSKRKPVTVPAAASAFRGAINALRDSCPSHTTNATASPDRLHSERLHHGAAAQVLHPAHLEPSRLTAEMAELVRDRAIAYTAAAPPSMTISGLCVFCRTPQTLSREGWKAHLLAHTNEKSSLCRSCHAQFDAPTQCTACHRPKMVTTFGAIASSSALHGFLCKECNAVQVGEESMRRHIVAAHPAAGPCVAAHYALVQLLPDMVRVRPPTVCQPIIAGRLYACCIADCQRCFDDANAWQAHIYAAHGCHERQRAPVQCRHCNATIANWTAEKLLKHTMLHAQSVYQCGICKRGEHTHSAMIQHMVDRHAEQSARRLRFLHWHRRPRGGHFDRMAEHEVCIKCRSCGLRFVTVQDVRRHVADVHRSRNIRLSVVECVKATVAGGETDYRTRELFVPVQQAFECKRCNAAIGSKALLLAHHERQHAAEPLAVAVSETWHVAGIDADKSLQNARNLAIDRNVLFVCVHCYKGGQHGYYATVETVFAHWLREHSADRLLNGAEPDRVAALSSARTPPEAGSVRTPQPFQFYADELMACYHCDLISTHQGLRKHHEHAHPTDPLAIRADSGDDHKPNAPRQQCNPKAFSPQFLDHLRTLQVPAKYRCLHCSLVFDTNQLYTNHHCQVHAHLLWSYERPSTLELDHCIAGCCLQRIKPDQLLDHVAHVKHGFECKQCDYKVSDPYEMAEHNVDRHRLGSSAMQMYSTFLQNVFWRTEFVFGNGLTVNQNNLRPTEYFRWQRYQAFIADAIVARKERSARRQRRPDEVDDERAGEETAQENVQKDG